MVTDKEKIKLINALIDSWIEWGKEKGFIE